ncbi:MAG: hypothetical protein A2Y28_04030 [Chlamydiae bacterium GWC2_50_10]|nr:MAG: hypothetical protein A2Y28_04030 [Chlamydiae bacterium GWC2_50_10]OGN55098.1 MAG: hypothetical protein A2098_01580 [Chlamydiae bacterium GWF2_49_8]OGN57430.1 MAG: hypothetical protein A3D18_01135 [Chlamydiae bacterium RIFCSPHIGHO2_02_FULL_49_29]OGN64592.1 MAG: hypothetical protein A3E26_06200 [Chlamydiae bacterium RIFCSPHIGHO2_12_FULL_49_32]OGN68328.1 MAG: hypothetical protein A3I15_04025 [Chlamydiae bacterium RIFCSPLOWO2_02_FULL_49_12]OGN72321.1 MAG: hypothetical protein A3G30_04385 [
MAAPTTFWARISHEIQSNTQVIKEPLKDEAKTKKVIERYGFLAKNPEESQPFYERQCGYGTF